MKKVQTHKILGYKAEKYYWPKIGLQSINIGQPERPKRFQTKM